MNLDMLSGRVLNLDTCRPLPDVIEEDALAMKRLQLFKVEQVCRRHGMEAQLAKIQAASQQILLRMG